MAQDRPTETTSKPARGTANGWFGIGVLVLSTVVFLGWGLGLIQFQRAMMILALNTATIATLAYVEVVG